MAACSAVLSVVPAELNSIDLLGVCLWGALYFPYSHTRQPYTSLCQTLQQQICHKWDYYQSKDKFSDVKTPGDALQTKISESMIS